MFFVLFQGHFWRCFVSISGWVLSPEKSGRRSRVTARTRTSDQSAPQVSVPTPEKPLLPLKNSAGQVFNISFQTAVQLVTSFRLQATKSNLESFRNPNLLPGIVVSRRQNNRLITRRQGQLVCWHSFPAARVTDLSKTSRPSFGIAAEILRGCNESLCSPQVELL